MSRSLQLCAGGLATLLLMSCAKPDDGQVRSAMPDQDIVVTSLNVPAEHRRDADTTAHEASPPPPPRPRPCSSRRHR